MAGRSRLQRASQSRVFLIEGQAGPSHAPRYMSLARMTGVAWGQGDITPIRRPSEEQYGEFVVEDTIQGQVGLPTTTLEARMTRELSDMLKLATGRCAMDLHLHVGACKDPHDFNAGWDKIHIVEEARPTNYNTDDLGALDADQESVVMETLDVTGARYYEVKPLVFGRYAESQIVQSVVDVVICDAKTCATCGLPSDGCQRIFAIQVPAGASPGLPAEVVFTINGGTSWDESIVTSLAANRAPDALACVGPYLVVVSNADDSIQYASIVDLIAGTETWVEVTTGLVGAGSPNDILSLGRDKTWIVGDGGYIYFSTDITAGVDQVQQAGDLTSQNLGCIHALNSEVLLVGGASNALLLTRNGGLTWESKSGPSAQSAVTINGVWLVDENSWFVAYNDGTLYYTIDAGVNWTAKALPGSLTTLTDIQFSTRNVGYIAGNNATAAKILRTIDGGYSWYVAPEATGATMPTASSIAAIAACEDDPNILWAGGLKAAGGDGILIKGA